MKTKRKARTLQQTGGLLAGKLEYLTVMDFRLSPGDVFTQVQMGKTYVLTKQGKPCAVLSPLPGGLTINFNRDGTVSYSL